MSWYKTEEEAKKACEWKEREYYPSKFFPLKDGVQPDCWWAQRVKEEL